jgi:mono/diheme cytochrome c family protein
MNGIVIFKRLIGGVLLALVCVAPPTLAQSSDNAKYTKEHITDADGAAVFKHICQGCHMPDAKGAQGAGNYPALASNLKLASAAYMSAVVMYGRRDMPAFASNKADEDGWASDATLTNEQIADVINYVRTHFGNEYHDPITANDVAAMRH